MKHFSRCVLVVACAQALAVDSLRAADTRIADSAGPLEHVLVTMPLHKEAAETALPFVVLTGDELRRSAAATLGDTLGSMPGMANASFGPGVGQPVIRGQQGPRVRVLQNGTSSADAARASQDHANAVEALLADSIEILRGPSTLLYGGGAIGGVVNVIDSRIPARVPDGAQGGVEYRRDTASDMDVVVGRFETGSGPFAFHVDGMYRNYDDLEIPGMARRDLDDHDEDHDEAHDEDHDHEDEEGVPGVLGNTAGRASSFTVGGSYHFDSGFFGLAVNRLENEYGLPEGSHAHDHEDEEGHGEHDDGHEDEHAGEEEEGGITLDMEQTRYDAQLHIHAPVRGIEVARGFLTYTDYQHAEIEGNGEVGTLYGNEAIEGRLEIVHSTVAGFDGVFGLQTSGGEFSAIGEEAFIPITDYQELGLFLIEDYHTERWTFEFGLRYDREERDPQAAQSHSFNAFSTSASALWQVSEPWQLGIALSRAERAPSIEELYSNVGNDPDSLVLHAATSAYEVGNPDLDTEVSQNLDVSVRWRQGPNRASLQAYFNDFADYINLVNTGDMLGDDPVRVFDQEDATFVGIELDSEFELFALADGNIYLGIFGDVTRGELASGDDVPRLPPRRIGARVAWESERLSVWARIVDAAEQDKPGANEEATPGFTRWDAGADYRAMLAGQEVNVFLTLNNISDEDIRLSTSFLRDVAPEQGFGMEAGVRLRF